MAAYRVITPIPGPEAFEDKGRSAQLSQAAFVMAAGSGVGGYSDRLPRQREMVLPDLAKLERKRKIPIHRALTYVDVEPAGYVEQRDLKIPSDAGATLARSLLDRPDPIRAASLVEASMHSPHRLVRTAAAVAALDTTGPRADVLYCLTEGARARDPLTRDISRTALARVDPEHAVFRNVKGRPARLTGKLRKSNTAVLSHGTFASRSRWWRPGGDFYQYLDGLAPPLHLHDPSFRWSGVYSDSGRRLAADQLRAWVADQQLQTPDFFAHSHGGTVGNLATRDGLTLDRLVLLSWPVHREWFPSFGNVQKVIDIRVRFDLVIIADRGGQTFDAPRSQRDKVESHKHGWFDHGDTHDPGYWDTHDLPDKL
jgi:hypothetical protein